VNIQFLCRTVACSVLLLTVVACSIAPKERLLLPEKALDGSASYALLWVKPCIPKLLGGCEPDDGRTTEAKLAIHGATELLDLKQQYEDEIALSASIARVNAIPVIEKEFLRRFTDIMDSKGVKASAVANPIYEGALRKRARTKRIQFDEPSLLGATQFPIQVKANAYDFTALNEKLGVDFIIALELLRFNIERHYTATGKPASNPHAVAAIRVYVHDASNGELLFDDYAHRGTITGNEWDAPPHYELLATEILNNLRDSIDDVARNFQTLEFRL